MALLSKESLEALRQRVDLVEVIARHVDLKRAGSSYKCLCPFHDERTPSFVVQQGDTHYHCFGCGAHGDAIQFLMSYQRMTFTEAVESLAERFHVPLERVEGEKEEKGPNKGHLKEVLELACRFYHFYLLQTQEGREAMDYLQQRKLDLDFINLFEVGLAPAHNGILIALLQKQGYDQELLKAAGLVSQERAGKEFFHERITFPIRDAAGAVIGFSARKYKESTFGGKYINTPETLLFRKSRVLFGLNYCRRRIAKERQAIIVEGQIDALRLIQAGFNITVAAQGTAFGEGHAKELLQLGAREVYLALDGDNAGQEAASKIGNLFQKEGVEVYIVQMPSGMDPDSLLNQQGPEGFQKVLGQRIDYLTFLVEHLSKTINMHSPAGKSELVQTIAQKIREWNHPLMVHESLRKLALLVQVPEEVVGVGSVALPQLNMRRAAHVGQLVVDPNRILEADVLRWLLLMGEEKQELTDLVRKNLIAEDFRVPSYRGIYESYMKAFQEQRPRDLLAIAIDLESAEGQEVISEILQKKINREKALDHLGQSILKILERNWMEKREAVKRSIQSGKYSDEQVLELVKQFDHIKKNPPQIL